MILISGATDGIGLALAHHYDRAGRPLLLVGRKASHELGDALFTRHYYCQVDLAAADAAATLIAYLQQHQIAHLDVVIHNAGVGYLGDVATQTEASIRELVQVNLVAPIVLTRRLLPNVGKLVFVSSITVALATPQYAVYAATKAALDGFARSLRLELDNQVAVQVLHPGPTRSGMQRKLGIDARKARRFADPQRVAAEMAQAIDGERPQHTVGRGSRLLWRVGRLLGGGLDRLQQGFGRPIAHGKGGHCVITGAADGIGRQLALQYARAGYRITSVDVDGERSAALQQELRKLGADGDVIVTDIMHDQAWIDSLAPVDVFIHNAGISASGPFAAADAERLTQVIAVNLTAPLLLTRRLLAGERLRPGASLVMLSSLSHFAGYPGAAVYAATKDGLAHYARSLGVALYPQQHVLTVFPGPTRTAHARRYSPDNSNEARRMEPAKLARLIYRAQQRGKRRLTPGSARWIALAGRLAPRFVERQMKRLIYDKLTATQQA